MIEFTFSERPVERRVELSPTFIRLAILTILDKYPSRNFSISQIQVYLWGLLSLYNMQKLYMLKKKGTIDVIPIYDVPELDAIMGELYINHVVKVNGAKFQITSEGQQLMCHLKNEDLVKELKKSISPIGYLGETVLNNINLSLNYAEFL